MMKTQEQIETALQAIQEACLLSYVNNNGAFDFAMSVQSTILWVLDYDDPKTALVQRLINIGPSSRSSEVR